MLDKLRYFSPNIYKEARKTKFPYSHTANPASAHSPMEEYDAGASVDFSPWSAILFPVHGTTRSKFRCVFFNCFYQQPTTWLGRPISGETLILNRKRFLNRRYNEHVTNVRYAGVCLTTVRREWCFAISECFETSPLVTSRISRERERRYKLAKSADLVVILPLGPVSSVLLNNFGSEIRPGV